MNTSIISFLKQTLVTAVILALSVPLLAAPPEPAKGKGTQARAQNQATSQKGAQAQQKTGATISINKASADQLTHLPRIGPKIAERIIAFRQQHGAFKKLEDLMNVKGIGEKTFAQLRPLIQL